jgi:hypothetical protein
MGDHALIPSAVAIAPGPPISQPAPPSTLLTFASLPSKFWPNSPLHGRDDPYDHLPRAPPPITQGRLRHHRRHARSMRHLFQFLCRGKAWSPTCLFFCSASSCCPLHSRLPSAPCLRPKKCCSGFLATVAQPLPRSVPPICRGFLVPVSFPSLPPLL